MSLITNKFCVIRVGNGNSIYAAAAPEIEALVGSTAHLDCKVDALHDKLVISMFLVTIHSLSLFLLLICLFSLFHHLNHYLICLILKMYEILLFLHKNYFFCQGIMGAAEKR